MAQSISINQLTQRVGISADEIKEVCEFLGNPVRQEGDRTVVPDFRKKNGETVSAEAFFRMLIQAAPAKEGKPDVLAAAIELKTQMDDRRNNQTRASEQTANNHSSQTRITFNDLVGTRLGIESDKVDDLDPNSIMGLGVQAVEAIAPKVAAQLDYVTKESVMAFYLDRMHNGTPEDPKLMTQEEKEALGKSQDCSISNVLTLISQGSTDFGNLVDFNSQVQSTFASHQLEPSRTTPALPQKE